MGGSVKPGDVGVPGKMWWQLQSSGADKACWEYYIDDGVDGKKDGWYPYTKEASAQVEDIFAQHGANKSGARTSTRFVKSGHFSYSINFDAFTQTNSKTNKTRPIRRVDGSAELGTMKTIPMKHKEMKKLIGKKPLAIKKGLTIKKVLKKKQAMMKKVMKKKKAMKKKKKAMRKKKATRVSKIARGRYRMVKVFKGLKEKTSGGLKKDDVMLNKRGKVVSKRRSARAKIQYKNISGWHKAFMQARKVLGITGFLPVKKGTQLYIKTREFYDADSNKGEPLDKSGSKDPPRKTASKSLARAKSLRAASSKNLDAPKRGLKRKASQIS